MKFLIIGSKDDPASRNIMMNLMDYKLSLNIISGDMLNENNLDKNKIEESDFVIFVSKHKSEKSGKTLSVHSPGNWKEVWGGGLAGRVCPSSASFQKHLFQTLSKNAEESELRKYNVTMEVTHHGPLISKPCVFIEVGGGEEEWKDRRAAFCIAKTVRDAIETWKENPYQENVIGIGGNHYCAAFNKLQLSSNVAFSHIIPKYVEPITEPMILEAINNTVEEVDFAVVDWKGLGIKDKRDKVIAILEKNYITWKKSTDVKR